MQVIITTWKNVTNTVIKLHAIYSMIISKFTGNVSKHTSKSTSKTNRIRLGGHGALGSRDDLVDSTSRVPEPWAKGPTLTRAARRLHWPCPLWVREPRAKVQAHEGPMAPWGGIRSREARMGVDISPLFPRYVLPDGPTRCSGTIRGSRRNSLGRTRFFYSQSIENNRNLSR